LIFLILVPDFIILFYFILVIFNYLFHLLIGRMGVKLHSPGNCIDVDRLFVVRILLEIRWLAFLWCY